MIRIGKLQLGEVPRIAVPLSDVELRGEIKRLKPYVDILELRVDQFEQRDPDSVRELCREASQHGAPLLGTVRWAHEGGRPGLTDSQRLQLFQTLVPEVDAVDIELRAAIRSEVVALADKYGKPVIVSYHDFERTPPDNVLVEMIETARQQGADIVKVAATACSPGDADRMLGLLRSHRSNGLILISMGEHGTMSRVFFPLLGSLVTFGFARQPNAPGQLSVEALFEELRRYSPEFRKEKSLPDKR
jgi:3-dehydroquinate dehydratase-1